MTTTDTMDTNATVEQSIRIIEAGADYVRITAPSLKEAENLAVIKRELKARGYNTPLIADIHFIPRAAETAAKIVEKVRVNPGNYADRKRFKVFEVTDEMYQQELDRIYKEFAPLVKVCKEYGTAMRIGTNHGSLSDRIMNRYGDTPMGMVESALEFVRICEDLDYHEIVLSMKASNPKVMVQAYRLLVNRMEEEGMNYPIHLGVTEAGDGSDGRIKSALGIGLLLEDGIGDTIRVSLTEEPEFEIPVCKKLIEKYSNKIQAAKSEVRNPQLEIFYNPFEYSRRETIAVYKIGNHHVPVVIVKLDADEFKEPDSLSKLYYSYNRITDKWNIGDLAPDFIYLGSKDLPYSLPGSLKKIFDYDYWITLQDEPDSFPLFTQKQYLHAERKSHRINFVETELKEFNDELINAVSEDKFCVLVLKSADDVLHELRGFYFKLLNYSKKVPVILKGCYNITDKEKFQLCSSSDIGGLLIDGFGDGVWLESKEQDTEFLNETCFGILQASRMRITKTEYISCPSCGRTQFDLQETTAMIKEKTSHLKGVKIAVMGCIVNGPGEMADADYGFVGSGAGWVNLYKGKEVVERGIRYDKALDKLIELIKENGDWVEESL
jgi:(E)-4-hydroxy-3-methylbut-2-enyl-diphosphate synthase